MKVKFNEKEIPIISKKLLDTFLNSDRKEAVVVFFSGDLGAGKTTVTKEIAKQLGIIENIISPTFVIIKIYKINKNSKYYSKFKKLIHIDAYRLDSHKELLNIGWSEIIKDKDNLVILEWPERVQELISEDFIQIKLSHLDEKNRQINF